MGYGLGVFLLAIGLILALAVRDSIDADRPDSRRLDPGRVRCPGDRAPRPAGQPGRGASSVATTTHADGTQTTTEQRNQVDPPPHRLTLV